MDWVATFFHSSAVLSSDYVHFDLCFELLRCLCDFQDPVFQQICHLNDTGGIALAYYIVQDTAKFWYNARNFAVHPKACCLRGNFKSL